MSVTGIILWCFLDPTKAKSFDTNLKGKLKKMAFLAEGNNTFVVRRFAKE
jgi:hypothetical protein